MIVRMPRTDWRYWQSRATLPAGRKLTDRTQMTAMSRLPLQRRWSQAWWSVRTQIDRSPMILTRADRTQTSRDL